MKFQIVKTIKTEDFVFNNKTYTIKVWESESLKDFIVQAFQAEVPVSYQLWLDEIQADDMRLYYSANPIDMMVKQVQRFVKENEFLKNERLQLEMKKMRNQIPATA